MNSEVITIGSCKITAQGKHRGGQGALKPRSLWAIVPVKALARAKQRLKMRMGAYTEDFTLAMLADVLAALADSETVTGVAVVTPDPRVAALAAKCNMTVVDEPAPRGLNAAIELGIENVRRLGASHVVILPGDIPLLTGAELDRLVARFSQQAGGSGEQAVGICPSQDRDGTNCLLLSTRQAFAFHYGPGSFSIHKDSAEAHKRQVYLLYSATIALDVDEPRHVDEVLAFCVQNPDFQNTETWKFLHSTARIGREAESA